jgi:hypothetical protein
MSIGKHRHNLAGYFFFTLSITLVACGEKVVDLDKKGTQTTTYEALPKEVQLFIDNSVDSAATANNDLYFSTDPAIAFTYAKNSIPSTGWMDDAKVPYHHFFIDGAHYRMTGEKGQPFILDNGVIYFCDVNLLKGDYKTRPYFKVEAIAH